MSNYIDQHQKTQMPRIGKSKSDLLNDIMSNPDKLSNHGKDNRPVLQELTSQSISSNRLKTNFPKIRKNRRETQPKINGMRHGYFGKQRWITTPFGSPLRMGDLHHGAIKDLFENQYALDIETKSLKGSSDSIFQLGFGYGDNVFKSVFIQQEKGFNLKNHHFLYTQSELGPLSERMKLDFSQAGKIPKYKENLLGKGSKAKVFAEIDKKQNIEKHVQGFIESAKRKGKNILVTNGNFEIDHINHSMSYENQLKYSNEYLTLRSELSRAKKADAIALKTGQITEQEFFNRQVQYQLKAFEQVISDAKQKKGYLIEMQEISKTLNAVAQQKELIPKTGRFAVGSSIDTMSKMFLNAKELHEAVTDGIQQGKLATPIIELIRDIQLGKVTKDNLNTLSEGKQRFFKTWNQDGEKIYRESAARMVKNEYEARGHLDNLLKAPNLLSNSAINTNEILKEEITKFKEALPELKTTTKPTLAKTLQTEAETIKMVRVGAAIFATAAVVGAVKNLFSGRDDDSNTIEGMNHGGMAEKMRKQHTSFGSGFRTMDYHNANQNEDSDSHILRNMTLVGAGAYGLNAVKDKTTKTKLNDLTYLGQLQLDKTNEEVLGRHFATTQDIAMAGVRRFENSLGGLPKTLGVGDVLSFGQYDAAEFTVNIAHQKNISYAQYMDKLTNRELLKEGIDAVTFSKGKLILHKGEAKEILDGSFNLIKTVHDYNLQDKISPLARSALNIKGIKSMNSEIPFLPIAGKKDFMNIVSHESFVKYLKLLDDPLEAVRTLMPDVNSPLLEKIGGMIPKIRLGTGEAGYHYLGSAGELLQKHALRLGGVGAALYFGYGTLDWAARQIAPDGTPMGDAGITGLGASLIKNAHLTYARMSDITGLTSLRKYVDEKSPDVNGWGATLGLVGAGALAGGTLATLEDFALEAKSASKYAQFLKNSEETFKVPEILRKIPGFEKDFTRVGSYARTGGVIGLALSLPFLISGFGAEKSADELEKEYSGETEVEVRKGRFWESSMTPYKGGEIDYYRPNWYRRLMDNPTRAEVYDGEDISPIGKFARSLVDPYWLEKRRYRDQPYPATGPDGSNMGIFGPLYEATIGRIMKPPAVMHSDELPPGFQDNNDYTFESLAKKQASTLFEAIGMRGFAYRTATKSVFGDDALNVNSGAQSSAGLIDSPAKSFYEMQLGGGFLTTEAARRIFVEKKGFGEQKALADIEVGGSSNPLRNNMPSWMPGSDYVKNFKEGDPFSMVKEGYYRLPGQGYAERYSELKGVNPEDYPDVFKYKILADVANGSREFYQVQNKLQNRELTPYEQRIFEQTQKELEEKKKSKLNTRSPEMHDSILGMYSSFLSDVARANPVEHLIPFSPAHKFLGAPTLMDSYDESIYAKDFKQWSNPISDFVKPTVSMALRTVGLGGIKMNPEEDQVNDYFDKLEYVKYKNLASEAYAKGQKQLGDQYSNKAENTVTGIDPYGDPNKIKKILPTAHQEYFERFSKISDATKRQEILAKVPHAYHDIYKAQWEKNDHSNNAEAQKILEQRSRAMRTRRAAAAQDLEMTSAVPAKTWNGWNPNVDIQDVKAHYLNNHGYDTHHYGVYADRLAKASRNKQVVEAVETMDTTSFANNAKEEAKKHAKNMGLKQTEVITRPSNKKRKKVSATIDRTDERDAALKQWNYKI